MKLLLSFMLLSTLLIFQPSVLLAEEKIESGKQAAIHYTLTLDDGTVVATTRNGRPLVYIHGTHNLVPGLEKALAGRIVGETFQIRVPPEEGYGEFQSGKIVEVRKNEVNGELRVGAFVEGTRPTGEMIRSRIVEVKDDTVVLDFNHPMAGKHLLYDVTVVGVQDSPASGQSN